VSSELAHTLEAAGVHTVRQLANVTDAFIEGVGLGGYELREKAKKHERALKLSEVAEEAEAQKLENEELKARLAKLEALTEQFAAPAKKSAKKQVLAKEGE
jgi:hypothetical protein